MYFVIFHSSEIMMIYDTSFSTGLLTFHAKYMVHNRANPGTKKRMGRYLIMYINDILINIRDGVSLCFINH